MVSGGVGTVWEKYTSIDKVMEQNEQLETENAELRQQMVDYDRIKAENEAYKALANIQKKEQQRHLCVRFVIGRDPLDEFGGFTLDKGTRDGVAVNNAVISDRGYLLGMVVEADPTSCKVMTILHPSFNAAGVVSRTRENGILTGSADLCRRRSVRADQSGPQHRDPCGRSGHHHRSGRGVPGKPSGGYGAGSGAGAERQILHCGGAPRCRPPHRQACFHHYRVLRRAHMLWNLAASAAAVSS